MLMREAAKEYDWHLNYAGIALMWRGGCIIKSSVLSLPVVEISLIDFRSVFLGDISAAYNKNDKLENLLFDDFFNKAS